jgi:hypothetical protein
MDLESHGRRIGRDPAAGRRRPPAFGGVGTAECRMRDDDEIDIPELD